MFVALELPPEYHEGLARIRERYVGAMASRMSWTRPKNWHLTLRFLGETGQVGAVADALDKVRAPGFALRAGTAGFFPSSRSPRVVWLGLCQGAGECAALARQVEAALVPLGFAPEARPFRPHLTVARVRRQADDDWRGLAEELSRMRWPTIRVESFSLMHSEPGPEGPEYSRVKSVPLGG